MKILFFSRLFYPHIGGVEKHVLEISKILIKEGHKVTVITEKHDKNLLEKEKIKEILIYRIPVGENEKFKKFQIWWWLLRHMDLIQRSEIVHCHDVFFWYLPFRFLFIRKPIYTTFHGYESYPISKKSIVIHKLSEILSWGNICIGDFIKKWYGTKANYVTYGGVNKIKNSPSKADQPMAEKLRILFVGRLEKDTGVKIYLKALEILKRKKVNFVFEACGNGSLRLETERFGKVHGFVEDLSPFFSRADIVFASSYLSILEALVNKKIVISVYSNELKEDYLRLSPFRHFILIYNSVKEVSRGVESIISNSWKYKSMREGSLTWAQRQTWGTVASAYLKLWNV